MKKGEASMLAAVNETLQELETSGEAAAIFERWLGANTIYKIERTFKIQPIGR